ncbi:uncharacterized protein [Typha latifolia]|uniref:uncharacterized protein n=1 Tax=Typha latifolia TaxID=4733 RepID=UPI003C2EB4C1
MDSVLLESPSMAKSLGFGSLGGPSFQSMLKESVDRFLVEVQRASCDFSAFHSIFFRLLQSSVDPPLEIIWFYSAVGYHESIASRKELISRLMAVKDLLQLLSACSASCGGTKCIALLAPVVSELYYCILEANKLSGKEAKKVMKQIESLVEGVLSYISISSSKRGNGRDSADGFLLPGFRDLVRVWTVLHSSKGNGFGLLFPLVNEEITDGLGKDGCGIEYLAGVVITEAFLLRLCLKVQGDGTPRPDLQKELRIWAVSSITVFQNRVFFGILLRLLLDPLLPVSSLLGTMDENVVRDILYDALILVDYSFINPEVEVEQADDSIICIVMTRLIVSHEAIQVARNKGDQGRAMSYLNAFSTSSIPNSLIKWITHQVALGKPNRPNSATPQALLKWVVDLEDKGMRLFGDNLSKLLKRLIYNESKVTSEGTIFNSASKRTDADLFFFDKQGDAVVKDAKDDDMEMMDNAFMVAANSMKLTSNGRRKRKGGNEGEFQAKFVKYDTIGSGKDYFSPVADDMSSGSEVENPSSDDDMAETE